MSESTPPDVAEIEKLVERLQRRAFLLDAQPGEAGNELRQAASALSVQQERNRELEAQVRVAYGFDRDAVFANIDALTARAEAAEARLAEAEKVLAEIARGTVPPEREGHYLAHRACVKAARSFLSSKGKDEFGQTNGAMHSDDPKEVQPTRSVSSAGDGE